MAGLSLNVTNIDEASNHMKKMGVELNSMLEEVTSFVSDVKSLSPVCGENLIAATEVAEEIERQLKVAVEQYDNLKSVFHKSVEVRKAISTERIRM